MNEKDVNRASIVNATTKKQDTTGSNILGLDALMSFAQNGIIDADALQQHRAVIKQHPCAAVIEVE